ncbi:unnamed protein product [Blepharisma stoltei]|uniref:KIF-binding protein n=1 Tax=Blepharisma stoltei TaxID=1481888 RepID=A0AAU9JE24_9CILI|nr:unnamed protein product [Blepharisma stoltei]
MEVNFFYSSLQRQLEEVDRLMGLEADSSKPYEHKYKAREILNSLLNEERVKENDESARAAQAIIEYLLGVNHFETEEITESNKHYKKSLKRLLSLHKRDQGRYINTFQDVLNALGILACNRGESQLGLEYFFQAQALYQGIQTLKRTSFSHNFKDFLTGVENFRFIIDGGVNHKKAEQNYTLTLFYMAQAYSKLGEKEKSAKFCAETMERQIRSDDYDIKDWAVNAINMAEYYNECGNLNQALYTLQCGMAIIKTPKKKLESSLHMQIGRCYISFLDLGVKLHQEKAPIPESVYQQCMIFEPLNIPFPRIEPPLNIDSAKELFKLANTSFKHALDYFVIDGYVTEHIEMKRDISSLYRLLSYFEMDENRIIAMAQRRLELLEGYTRDINKQAYSQLWQRLMNEVASVYLDLYEVKQGMIKGKKKKREDLYTKVNIHALSSIEKQMELLEFIQKFELNEDSAKDVIQSSLNLMFGIARIYSKMDHPDISIKVDYMEKGFRWYEKLQAYLREIQKGPHASKVPDLVDQMKVCEEMCELLPRRISQVNAERE